MRLESPPELFKCENEERIGGWVKNVQLKIISTFWLCRLINFGQKGQRYKDQRVCYTKNNGQLAQHKKKHKLNKARSKAVVLGKRVPPLFFVFGVAQGSKERIALMELHFYFISFVDAPQLYLYSYLELFFFYLYFQRQMPHLYFSWIFRYTLSCTIEVIYRQALASDWLVNLDWNEDGYELLSLFIAK